MVILTKRIKGSLTIEAAMVLPIFLVSMIALASLINIITANIRLQNCMYEKARELSITCDAETEVDCNKIRDEIIAEFGAKKWDNCYTLEPQLPIISLLQSPKGDYAVLSAAYKAGIPFTGDKLYVPVTCKILFHNWVGYDEDYHKYDFDDVIVYVAQNESVYHLDRDCSHISIAVVKTTPEEVVNLRNASGGKYKKCSLCHSSLNDPILYVTKEGDRFHNDRNCSACKRIVRAVRLSEVGELRPCSRCKRKNGDKSNGNSN